MLATKRAKIYLGADFGEAAPEWDFTDPVPPCNTFVIASGMDGDLLSNFHSKFCTVYDLSQGNLDLIIVTQD